MRYDRLREQGADVRGLLRTVLDAEAPRVTDAGCLKLGGTAVCADDCRTCPHRGVRPA